ncbi:MAG: efflux RND transporter periplasmic adaptor subunit [Betaproteobacteria bacterium]|nr:efflux RND transporter periplasmic adaptor subunit [Betaproteobacteria bacterium]
MNPLSIALLLAGLLTLAACGDQAAETGKTKTAAEAAHADHGSGGEKLTHFSDRTELFVEFPRLVVGEKSAFAAHLSRLSDFKAVTAGKVTVRLGGDGQPDEVFGIDGPSQPGIFRPEATPKHAGERELSIEVSTPEFSVTHALGPITVFPDRKAAESAPGAHDDEGIGFTKEQQWKVDFATAEVVTRPIRSVVDATGTLRARPDGEALLTAQTAGQIKPAGAFPRLGQAVSKGQVLAYLVPRLGGDTDLASLEAAARKAKVELDLAGRELARLEGLYRDEVVPEKRVQAARAAEASARAEHDAARQRLGQYGGNSGGAGGGVPIRAPVAGTIADVRVSPGTFAQEGALLFHIADRRGLWLELRVPESEAARLSTPGGASFRVAGDERGIEIIPGRNGRLIAVGGVVDAATRTLPVIFEFTPPTGQQLPIGMAVQAQVFAGGAREAVAIPASSVLDEGGMAVVFVQAGGESFERRTVRLGAREGDWVEVLDGLTPGSRVVSRGAYLVKLASTGTAQIGHGHAH